MPRHYVTSAVQDRSASRPVAVIDDLARLRGATSGIVTLPITLNWTPRTHYDLGNPAALHSLYQVVLREAMDDAELEAYLDGRVLVRIWHSLVLPATVRVAWEREHPALAAWSEV